MQYCDAPYFVQRIKLYALHKFNAMVKRVKFDYGTLTKIELMKAVEKVKEELREFGERLNKTNDELQLDITAIDNVLIWYDDNY